MGAGEALPGTAEFAARLRELRKQAGSPSFRELARRTHYSASTLAEATAGKRLPTEAVVKAFVAECGGNPDEWVQQLREVITAQRSPDPVPSGRTKSRQRRLGAVIAVVAGVFVVGGATGWFVATATAPPAVSQDAPFDAVPASAPPSGPVPDGADPIAAGCAPDAVLVDRTPVMIEGKQIGALELKYSPHCHAAWARVFLYPGQPTMMGLASVRANDGRMQSLADLLVKQIPIYTNVVVPTPGGCIGAQAVVLQAGHPLASASITCQAPGAH
jgi:transcriptional regulator with XRE-family HTH domain